MQSTEPEIWKPVIGHEGQYEVSDLGRVRSVDRLVDARPGVRRIQWGRVRAQVTMKSGHKQITLWTGNRARGVLVHRLVLDAFSGPCPDGMEACHADGNPGNNRIANLRWDSRSENRYDSVRHGTHQMTARTHCPQGHPYDAANTYRIPSRPNARYCRACRRDRNQRARESSARVS